MTTDTDNTTVAATAHNGGRPDLTHAEGLALFEQVLASLARCGWTRQRIDTYVHYSTEAEDPKQRMTVRHQFDHGIWWLHYEPDRYWNPADRTVRDPRTRTAQIRLDRPDTEVRQILRDLFGPQYDHLAAPINT